MPPFASLSDQDRWDVVFYALSLSAPAGLLEAGKQIYQEGCANCHGEQGKDSRTDFSDPAVWAERSLQAVENAIANGSPPEMPAFSGSLQPDEIRAAAAYLRSFSQAPASGELKAASGSEEPPSSAPAAPDKLAVSGKIVHAAGKDLPPGLKVLLQVYENMQPVAEVEAKTQAGGSFTFPQVERVNGNFSGRLGGLPGDAILLGCRAGCRLPQDESANIRSPCMTPPPTPPPDRGAGAPVPDFENPRVPGGRDAEHPQTPHPVVVAAEKKASCAPVQTPSGAPATCNFKWRIRRTLSPDRRRLRRHRQHRQPPTCTRFCLLITCPTRTTRPLCKSSFRCLCNRARGRPGKGSAPQSAH